MTIYFVILFYICALGCIVYSKGVNAKKNKRFIILAFLPVFFLHAFRDVTVGVDTVNYLAAFDKVSRYGITSVNFEIGYLLLNQFIAFFTNNGQWLLAAVSSIMLLGFGIFIYENTDENESSFWILFLWMTLNHNFTAMVSLRQYTALAIGINIYTILKKDASKKGYIKSVIILLLAMSFHTSALICAVYYLMFLLPKINRKIIVEAGCACIFILLFFDQILNLMFKIFPRYQIYMLTGHEKFSAFEFGGIHTILLIGKLLIAGTVFVLNPEHEENKDIYRLACLNIISAGISLMITRVALLWRVGYYFDIFLILLLPKFVRKIKPLKTRRYLYAIIFILGVAYFYFLMYSNGAECVPYKAFWQ